MRNNNNQPYSRVYIFKNNNFNIRNKQIVIKIFFYYHIFVYTNTTFYGILSILLVG